MRAGTHVVGRLYLATPWEGESFYLLALLSYVKGAMASSETREVHVVQYNCFGEACNALGLLTDEAKWVGVFADAFRTSFPPLTNVFATNLANCKPRSPQDHWNDRLEVFITNIRNRFRG